MSLRSFSPGVLETREESFNTAPTPKVEAPRGRFAAGDRFTLSRPWREDSWDERHMPRRRYRYEEEPSGWGFCRTTLCVLGVIGLLMVGFWVIPQGDTKEVLPEWARVSLASGPAKDRPSAVFPADRPRRPVVAAKRPPPKTPKPPKAEPPQRPAPIRMDPSLSGIVSRAEKWGTDSRPTIIVTFGDVSYKGALMNWLAFAEGQGVTNWAVACMDTELRYWLQARGTDCHVYVTDWKKGVWGQEQQGQSCDGNEIEAKSLKQCLRACEYDPAASCKAAAFISHKQQCKLCSNPESRADPFASLSVKRTTETLWYARWRLLLRLLQQGLDVLLSDADAVIVQHPRPLLSVAAKRADISAQRGTFPPWISQLWGGSALCMGLSYWRSTEATKRFAVHMNGVILNTGDDQVAVNVALEQLGLQWEDGTVPYLGSKDVSFGTQGGLTVALLPHDTVPRNCTGFPLSSFTPGTGPVVVAHCYQSSKTGEAKQREAKARGLWLLRENWEDVAPVPNIGQYIQSVRA
eukprot:TRINITY_DN24860_c1_g1_i1.p1 TRINITY_DN24860_c1_g1~~TRINITY_DN24860_c1_g1_i1.p1  ORF type:complete len:520 (+),score=75.81 TRINITY_DN24860_c1_g1_i1:54-1613(+)